MKMLSKLKSYPTKPIECTITIVPDFYNKYERIQQIGEETKILSSSYVQIERKIAQAARQAQLSSEHEAMLAFDLQKEELMDEKKDLENRLNNLKDDQFSEFLELVDFACKPLNPDHEIGKQTLEEHSALMKILYSIVIEDYSTYTFQLESPEDHYDNLLEKRLIFSQFLKQFSKYLTEIADKGENILLLGPFGIKTSRLLSIQIEKLRGLIVKLCNEQSTNLQSIIKLKDKIRKQAQRVQQEGQSIREESNAVKSIDNLANLSEISLLANKNEEMLVARRKQLERQHKASYTRSMSLHQKIKADAVREKRKQQVNEAQIKALHEWKKNFTMTEGRRIAEEQQMKQQAERIQAELRAEQAAEERAAMEKGLEADRQEDS